MKIFLDTIGCRLNQSEIETYARQFRAAGHLLVSAPGEADLAVVNTCAVTAAAASDSRGKIRAIARAGEASIAVTGCWSTLHPATAASLPLVDRVITNQEKDHLVSDLLEIPAGDADKAELFDLEPLAREPAPGARLRTRAFIKVQDGCDNRCTFCVTTLARGEGRSRPVADILRDIRWAEASNPNGESGAKEVVLTGVHLGSWGQDCSPPQHLRHLIWSILSETEVPRIRLSSLEPWDLDEEFFSLWGNPRLCRHLHLPLQSGSGATLRRMARKTTPETFARLMTAARRSIPEVAITTDLIAGFPGEDDAEFAETVEFVRSMRFAGGHVFTYSARPGTAAARWPDQVPHPVRKERGAFLRALLSESGRWYQGSFLGKTLPVLWESLDSLDSQTWGMSGLTDNYLRVSARAPGPLWNQITPVRLTTLSGGILQGYLV
jgi:threonylcarbamoyladenosine tRNA methylthiotransferase MtaB